MALPAGFGRVPGSAEKGIKKVFATGLAEFNISDREGIGAIRREGRRTYKWVKYNQGVGVVAAVIGNVAGYYAAGGDAISGGAENSEVTSDYTDVAGIAAGVLMSAIPNGEFGWVQIKGPATLTLALTGGVDGNALTITGAGDGTLDVSLAVTDSIVAFATDASARKVLLDCPL